MTIRNMSWIAALAVMFISSAWLVRDGFAGDGEEPIGCFSDEECPDGYECNAEVVFGRRPAASPATTARTSATASASRRP